MKGRIFRALLITAILPSCACICGCEGDNHTASEPEVAAGNSYLECVVRDVLQSDEILSLVPPGMCPGHFDISPGQVSRLSKCKVLLVFDFQKRIKHPLAKLTKKGLKVHTIKARPGLCLPDTYLAACHDVCSILEQEDVLNDKKCDQIIKSINQRMQLTAQKLKKLVEQANLRGTKVLSSVHQARFCQWLGLNVVATFTGDEAETAGRLNEAIVNADKHSVELVIANAQQGDALAKALAGRLKAKLVVFSNFPVGKDKQISFDRMLTQNLNNLLGAYK